jgi:sodium/potassium/calcium exchanger 6
VNFFWYRYCFLESGTGLQLGLFVLTMVVYHQQVFLIIYSFIILGSVAETYLTPVLTKISDSLKLSETISGVTLLAFANGAPDILSVISAGGEEDGIYIAIGNLFGACLFSTTLVIGRCIFLCPKPIEMQPMFWNRDLIFYIITLCVVLAYGIIGTLTLPMSLSFFGIYAVYLAVVIFVVACHAAKLLSKERRPGDERRRERSPERRAAETARRTAAAQSHPDRRR